MRITLKDVQKTIEAMENASGGKSAPYIINMTHGNAKHFIEHVMKERFSTNKKGIQKCGIYTIKVWD